MATPTPPKRPGGTPSNVNQSSPAPRSVPSPVATRQPAGKTPVNHPTTGSTGSKTLASTPMVQNLSQTGNTSSPSANMLSFGTPSGLGIESATPAAMNLATPALGGTSMMPTMSDLGLTAHSAKRNEDEERRAKMRKVLKSIGKPKGRVSEEGIARVGRRVGFQNDVDAEKLTNEEKERKVGNRPIETAGNRVLVTVDLKNHVPRSVKVEFNPSNDTLDEQGILAGKVLLEDLRAPAGIALDAKLNRFAMNLERLATLDRLSASGINCFDALSGIYTSLCRLYDQEKLAAKTIISDTAEDAEKKADAEVTCKKSGKPVMHPRGKLGLEIVYWRDRNQFEPTSETDGTEMESDGQGKKTGGSALPESGNNIFALRIEAEASPAGLYPCLRLSETWLPDPLELPSSDSGEGIPWQEPVPTLVAPDTTSALSGDAGQKLPDLRFVAKLDPPLVVPLQTALNLFSAVGAPTPQVLALPPQYAAMLLDPSAVPHVQPSAGAFIKKYERSVLSQKDGEETMVKHRYVLNCAKPAYADSGFRIDELPFSHPRQLVELLPTLRQWASVGSLLKTTFSGSGTSQMDQPQITHHDAPGMDQITLDDLFTAPESASIGPIPVNISLVTTPIPTLAVTFPTGKEGQVGSVNAQILNNADVLVTNHEDIVSSSDANNTETGQKLAKALDVCSDLGVWVEWMRLKST